MSNLQVFRNADFVVRTLEENGNIWFVVKDVVKALEYTKYKSRWFHFVPDMYKSKKRLLTTNGEQDMLCLTEEGLYSFLGNFDKPKALAFLMWIRGHVVPSIKRTDNGAKTFLELVANAD